MGLRKAALLLFAIFHSIVIGFVYLHAQEKTPGFNGAVSSANSLATNAGVRILNSGGNAFDAAIAVAAMLNVTEPMMSGIGGYGTILIYDAKKKQIRYLNSSGKIPLATNSDLMRPPTAGYMENRAGAKSVSTPGNLHAWEALHVEYGRLKWTTLFQPAINTARNGFGIGKLLARSIELSFKDFSPYTRKFYGKNDQPLKQGELLVQQDLANSLDQISRHGVADFYTGKIAIAIDHAMIASEGFLRKIDLEKDAAEWYSPLQYNYKGYDIYTAAPPSNAFAAFISLGLMQSPRFHEISIYSPSYYHLFAEITKQSYAGRLKYSYDPEKEIKKIDQILSPGFFAETARNIRMDSATLFEPFRQPESTNTTHFVIVDRWGNMVSATQTLGNIFGSRIMPEGTGIWLNNSLAYCTYEPKGNPMDAFAGRHKLSGDCPVIIMKENLPWAVLGTPGGHTITQNVPQIIFNLIDGNMSMQQAINHPKLVFAEPGFLVAEPGIPQEIKQYLLTRGHQLKSATIGNAHGIRIRYDKKNIIDSVEVAADIRGEGTGEILKKIN